MNNKSSGINSCLSIDPGIPVGGAGLSASIWESSVVGSVVHLFLSWLDLIRVSTRIKSRCNELCRVNAALHIH